MKIDSRIDGFIQKLIAWASAQPDIRAAALVGSYARGTAKAGSDIDLILLAEEPEKYLESTTWLEQFGAVLKQQQEDYGKVTSLRAWYAGGFEIEYGWTTPDWAAPPVDSGTQQVIQDGLVVLLDKEALLKSSLE
jgi:predicted nucleotidyltransferase